MKFLILLLVAQVGHAQTVDLRAKALQELETPQATTSNASATSVPSSIGILKLQDPKPTAAPETWHFFIQASLQRFQPKGELGNDLTSSRFDLGADGTTWMPAVELGFAAPLYSNDWNWRWGVSGRAAYASEQASAKFATGFSETDVHVNTTMLSFDPRISFQIPAWPRFRVELGAESGIVDYSQSSSNELANVNTHAAYWGSSLGGEFQMWRGWNLLLRDSRRALTKPNPDVALQRNTWELGVKAIW